MEDGLSSVLTVLEKKPVKDAVPPRDERHVVVELAKRFATPERLGTYGYEPMGYSPAQTTQFIRDEMARWARVVKEAGIKMEE